MHPLPVTDDGVQKRSTDTAAEIARIRFAPDEHRRVLPRDVKLLTLDPPIGLCAEPVAARHFEQ